MDVTGSKIPSSSRPPDSKDINLYCLECGYNLRGLSGDPRRCPECGHQNPLGSLELPAELITRQLRRMETAPTICVGACLVGLLFLALAGRTALDCWTHNYSDPGLFICLGVFGSIALLIWYTGVSSFQDSCLNKPGWKRALWRYHLYGLALALPVALGLPAIARYLNSLRSTTLTGNNVADYVILLGAGLALGAGLIAFIFLVGRWALRQIKPDMERLQREVSVTLAHKRLQQDLRRPKGRPFA